MTDYTFIITDQYVRLNRPSERNATLPTNASVPFPIGSRIRVRQVGDGRITIVPASGVTINTPFSYTTSYKGAVIELIKVATNEWDLSGDILTIVFDGSHNISENLVTSEVISMVADFANTIEETVTGTEVVAKALSIEFNETLTNTEDFVGNIGGATTNNLLENGDTLVLEDGTSTLLQEDGA